MRSHFLRISYSDTYDIWSRCLHAHLASTCLLVMWMLSAQWLDHSSWAVPLIKPIPSPSFMDDYHSFIREITFMMLGLYFFVFHRQVPIQGKSQLPRKWLNQWVGTAGKRRLGDIYNMWVDSVNEWVPAVHIAFTPHYLWQRSKPDQVHMCYIHPAPETFTREWGGKGKVRKRGSEKEIREEQKQELYWTLNEVLLTDSLSVNLQLNSPSMCKNTECKLNISVQRFGSAHDPKLS